MDVGRARERGRWRFQWERVEALEEKLRPKIKVLGVSEFPDIVPDSVFNSKTGEYTSASTDQVFELEIINDSGEELNNCLAKVEDLTVLTQVMIGDTLTLMDNSPPYRRHLPAVLRTAKNTDRDGGGHSIYEPRRPRRYEFVRKQSALANPSNSPLKPARQRTLWR